MRNILLAALLVASGAAFGASRAGAVGQMVGGFKPASNRDANVVAASRFAVRAQAQKQRTTMKLVSVHSAERQTVQGAVYRLCLVVEIEDRENNVVVDQGVRAQVYQNLKGEFTLNKWAEENCNEEEDEEQ
jgi:hypothetical protein